MYAQKFSSIASGFADSLTDVDLESLSSHGSYWFDVRFHTFVLSQLFVGDEDLERSGREEMESDD